MTLRVTMSVETSEDCQKASSLFAGLIPHMPPAERPVNNLPFSVNLGKVVETGGERTTYTFTPSMGKKETASPLPEESFRVRGEADGAVKENGPANEIGAQPVTAEEARSAENALLTEAVNNVQTPKRRGRPPKNPQPIQQQAQIIEEPGDTFEASEEDAELFALLNPVTEEPEQTEEPDDDETTLEDDVVSAEDDIMAMLGGNDAEEPAGNGKDRYDEMDHAALYAEVRKRSGNDIRAPNLAPRLRDAVQKDKKIDSVYKFTEDMLRNLLRDADKGLLK